MNFFKRSDQNKTTPKSEPSHPPTTPEEQAFNEAWFRALRRFAAIAGINGLSFNLHHPETKEILAPHAGVAGTFDAWKQIETPSEKERLLLSEILGFVSQAIKPWHVANMMTALRRPKEAFAHLEANPPANGTGQDYAEYCAACARVFMSFELAEKALEWATKAANAAPNDKKIQCVLADAMRLNKDFEGSSRIYSALLKAGKRSQLNPTGAVEEMIAEVFSRETGSVPSPLFAIEIGQHLGNQEQASMFWQLIETEFHDSHYLRLHHAYYLLDRHQTAQALAKLISIVKEFNWSQEAILNLEILFKQVDPSATKIYPELQRQVREVIRSKGWTTEGMKPRSLG